MIIRNARLEDAPHIAKVHVNSWQTTYKGLMPDEAIAARPVEMRQAQVERALSNEDRNVIMLVAEVDDDIVGFVSGGLPFEPNGDFESELYAIYLLEDAQGQGIGRALMKAFAEKLVEAGYTSMMLSVLKTNEQSRGFYEKLGGTLAGEGDYRVTEDVTLKTVLYGWQDIQTLLAES